MSGHAIRSEQRILIADDDRAIGCYLSRLLEREGYACDTASGVSAAWSRLQDAEHQLLLSDIQMPDGDGIELLARVRATFGDELAVVMVTGVHEKEVGIRAVELGAYSYLTKPFGPNEAIVHVANALERRRLTLEANRFQERLQNEVRDAQEEIGWRLLAAVGWRDIETGAHIRRVGRATHAVAERIGWDQENLAHLELAAAMHDVGKIAVPDSVLLKPGALTAAEYRLIQQHTVAGASMLGSSSNPLLQCAERIARSHHERWDGGGYPDGLAGPDIPEAARIVGVVDVFDALTSDRPYREAYDTDRAVDILLKDRGSHFDPEILDLFLEILPGMGFGEAGEPRKSARPSFDLLRARRSQWVAAG